MLYQKDGKYYMLRNREYIEVEVTLKDNELNIKPSKNRDVIEKNDNVKIKGVLIDEVIKELQKPKSSFNTNSDNKSKFRR